MIKNRYLLFFITLLAVVYLAVGVYAQPTGANVTSGQSTGSNLSNSPDSDGGSYSGNITELIISGSSNTQSWQGYFGNVTGNMQLADSSNNVFYNWSLVFSQGEVYASTNNTVSWSNMQCFNFTANGSLGSGGETAGGTNLGGRNASQLEEIYNILPTDPDGVDETFVLGGPFTHEEFYVANLNFSSGECPSVALNGQNESMIDGQFEEVVLYEPLTTSVVFTSLMEQNLIGFNNASNDFEMIVLEDGHSGNTATTPYYFFVEIG